MAKKRKAGPRHKKNYTESNSRIEYGIDEHFDDSADEFAAENDRILFDDTLVAKRQKKLRDQERELLGSDEEVYRDDVQDDSDSTLENIVDDGQGDNDEFWGTSKGDYYNADVIETEADALAEEQEAKRLMQKQLKSISEADFGFDDLDWKDEQPQTTLVEKLPEIYIHTNATDLEKANILRTRYPEFDPLVKNFIELQKTHQELLELVQVAEKETILRRIDPTDILKYRALTNYLAAIIFYFALLTSTTNDLALPPADLRSHEIMVHLGKTRDIWKRVQNLQPLLLSAVVPKPKDKQLQVRMVSETDKISKVEIIPTRHKRHLQDEYGNNQQPRIMQQDQSSEQVPQENQRPNQKLVNRDGLESILKKAMNKAENASDSDLGDEETLTSHEVEEKARKKKSLRFYTSQIAQKANKRGAASRDAGGDDDVPRKERLRDRQERLIKEAQQRAIRDHGADLKDNGSEDEKDISMNPKSLDDDYYDMLTNRSSKKKAEKVLRAEATALGQDYLEEEVGIDGKRKISYAIQKNKGLTPRRKKEVRNPRVKKKMMYDKKMKKLAVVRPQYKGGEGRGGYGGELTGIKSNVVKSIKL